MSENSVRRGLPRRLRRLAMTISGAAGSRRRLQVLWKQKSHTEVLTCAVWTRAIVLPHQIVRSTFRQRALIRRPRVNRVEKATELGPFREA